MSVARAQRRVAHAAGLAHAQPFAQQPYEGRVRDYVSMMHPPTSRLFDLDYDAAFRMRRDFVIDLRSDTRWSSISDTHRSYDPLSLCSASLMVTPLNDGNAMTAVPKILVKFVVAALAMYAVPVGRSLTVPSSHDSPPWLPARPTTSTRCLPTLRLALFASSTRTVLLSGPRTPIALSVYGPHWLR